MSEAVMHATSAPSSLRVLIVDDDPVFSALAEAFLLDAGCASVDVAEAGEDGMRRALDARPRPDLVVLDLNMPEFDGLAALRLLAALKFGGAIIIVSGEKAAILQASASLARMHGLRLAGTLSKPLNAGELNAALAALPRDMRADIIPPAAGGRGEPDKFARLVPAYQPKVRLADKRIYGAEALMRVQLASGRIVAPLEYLNSLTDLALLGDATTTFLGMILNDIRTWGETLPPRPVSVNVPAPLLEEGAFMEQFALAVRAAEVPPSGITIEMTEAALPNDLSKMVEVMTRLRMAGFGLAIDDYGTGMANYDILRLCPFTELKIDRSVVQAATHDGLACGFIGNCVSIARALSMCVVAEGVETSEQAEAVRRLGADVIQGYFFSRPLNAEQYSNLLRSADGKEVGELTKI
jgi:EAL domain-containing protein (putative c-di-GMP-specific phosphodiesterase class I)